MLCKDTNRFRATCYRCGKPVEPEKGLLEFPSFEQIEAWSGGVQRKVALVEHPECAEKFRGTFVHYLFQPEGTEQ
jgi:hypothetical protein